MTSPFFKKRRSKHRSKHRRSARRRSQHRSTKRRSQHRRSKHRSGHRSTKRRSKHRRSAHRSAKLRSSRLSEHRSSKHRSKHRSPKLRNRKRQHKLKGGFSFSNLIKKIDPLGGVTQKHLPDFYKNNSEDTSSEKPNEKPVENTTPPQPPPSIEQMQPVSVNDFNGLLYAHNALVQYVNMHVNQLSAYAYNLTAGLDQRVTDVRNVLFDKINADWKENRDTLDEIILALSSRLEKLESVNGRIDLVKNQLDDIIVRLEKQERGNGRIDLVKNQLDDIIVRLEKLESK